ncbi:MAG: exodeoxyribonuclease VII large subunit, partial [Myxococcales bacterium]|nr:exodeoxyribonuclease VII large subunit [Myxococcales bacterium]
MAWRGERQPGDGPRRGAIPVSELTLALKNHVEGAFRRVYVFGEVSGARPAGGGHLYFTLKDA